jgi:hypothetical protein
VTVRTLVIAVALCATWAPSEQRPNDPKGLQCGAAYVPGWALAEHVPFAENQVKACDGAIAAADSEAELRGVLTLIGLAITGNWEAYHGAATFLPKPGEATRRFTREEVASLQAQIVVNRGFLRILQALAQLLTRLPTDDSLTAGQKAVITERIGKPGPKACVAVDKWVWVGRVAGVAYQVVVPDPVLAEGLKSAPPTFTATVTAFDYETGPQGCVKFQEYP